MRPLELELELMQSHMAQKPVLRVEVGCACVAREVSVEGGGMGEATLIRPPSFSHIFLPPPRLLALPAL